MDPSITAAMERGGREWGQVPECIREALLSLNECISDIQRSQPRQERFSRSATRAYSPGTDAHSAARQTAYNRARQRTASEKRMRQSKNMQQLMEMHRTTKTLSTTARSLLCEEANEPPAVHDIYQEIMKSLFNHFVTATTLIQWVVSNFSSRQDFLHLGIPKHFYQNTDEKRYFQFSPSDAASQTDTSANKVINELDRRLAEARKRPSRRPPPEFDDITPVKEPRRHYSTERSTPTRSSNVATPTRGYSKKRPPTPTRSPSQSSAASVRNDPPSRKSSRSSMASNRRREIERQEAEQQRQRELQHEIDIENERLRAEDERKAKLQAELERQHADEIEELLEASRKLSQRSRVTSSAATSKVSQRSNTPPGSRPLSRESSVSIPQAGNIDVAERGISPHSEKESIRREKETSPDEDEDSDEGDMISKRTTMKMDILSQSTDDNDNADGYESNSTHHSSHTGGGGGAGGPDDESSHTVGMNSPADNSSQSSSATGDTRSIDAPLASKDRLHDSDSDDDDGGLKWG